MATTILPSSSQEDTSWISQGKSICSDTHWLKHCNSIQALPVHIWMSTSSKHTIQHGMRLEPNPEHKEWQSTFLAMQLQQHFMFHLEQMASQPQAVSFPLEALLQSIYRYASFLDCHSFHSCSACCMFQCMLDVTQYSASCAGSEQTSICSTSVQLHFQK